MSNRGFVATGEDFYIVQQVAIGEEFEVVRETWVGRYRHILDNTETLFQGSSDNVKEYLTEQGIETVIVFGTE